MAGNKEKNLNVIFKDILQVPTASDFNEMGEYVMQILLTTEMIPHVETNFCEDLNCAIVKVILQNANVEDNRGIIRQDFLNFNGMSPRTRCRYNKSKSRAVKEHRQLAESANKQLRSVIGAETIDDDCNVAGSSKQSRKYVTPDVSPARKRGETRWENSRTKQHKSKSPKQEPDSTTTDPVQRNVEQCSEVRIQELIEAEIRNIYDERQNSEIAEQNSEAVARSSDVDIQNSEVVMRSSVLNLLTRIETRVSSENFVSSGGGPSGASLFNPRRRHIPSSPIDLGFPSPSKQFRTTPPLSTTPSPIIIVTAGWPHRNRRTTPEEDALPEWLQEVSASSASRKLFEYVEDDVDNLQQSVPSPPKTTIPTVQRTSRSSRSATVPQSPNRSSATAATDSAEQSADLLATDQISPNSRNRTSSSSSSGASTPSPLFSYQLPFRRVTRPPQRQLQPFRMGPDSRVPTGNGPRLEGSDCEERRILLRGHRCDPPNNEDLRAANERSPPEGSTVPAADLLPILYANDGPEARKLAELILGQQSVPLAPRNNPPAEPSTSNPPNPQDGPTTPPASSSANMKVDSPHPVNESSNTRESPHTSDESRDNEETPHTEESLHSRESLQAEEISHNEESSRTKQSPQTSESTQTKQSPHTTESTQTKQSPHTRESTQTKESPHTEESRETKILPHSKETLNTKNDSNNGETDAEGCCPFYDNLLIRVAQAFLARDDKLECNVGTAEADLLEFYNFCVNAFCINGAHKSSLAICDVMRDHLFYSRYLQFDHKGEKYSLHVTSEHDLILIKVQDTPENKQ